MALARFRAAGYGTYGTYGTCGTYGAVQSGLLVPGVSGGGSPVKQSARHRVSAVPGLYLATTYSHRTYRPTTIGAAAFHFRVRNGTGWFHRAVVTRVQCRGRMAGAMRFRYCLSGDIELSRRCLSFLARSLASARRSFVFRSFHRRAGAVSAAIWRSSSSFRSQNRESSLTDD